MLRRIHQRADTRARRFHLRGCGKLSHETDEPQRLPSTLCTCHNRHTFDDMQALRHIAGREATSLPTKQGSGLCQIQYKGDIT